MPRRRPADLASLCCVLLLAALPWSGEAAPTAASATPVIIHPRRDCDTDKRSCYPVAVLKLAMSKLKSPARLRPTEIPMHQGRAIQELAANTGRLNVLWTMTSIEREAMLLPIRIPLDKGLFGWRIALIRADRYDIFKDVRFSSDLASLTAGQGHDWPDTEILRSAGLPVETGDSYEGLFQMLSRGRYDYFPRAVTEIWNEADTHRELGLVVEPTVVLHYPTALYFFVNKKDAALAELIRTGLERAIADGSFDQLFYTTFGQMLERSALHSRRMIELPNPLLPPDTPLGRPELWFRKPVSALPRNQPNGTPH